MKKQNGITLIALIVTIIVLLIITGVTIAILTGDNSVLRQANSTKVANIEGTAREEVELACAAIRIAIAQAQAENNTYDASTTANMKKIQETLVDVLNRDTKLNNKTRGDSTNKPYAKATEPAGSGKTFTIKYKGSDYALATNSSTENAYIEYTLTLSQSSIEVTKVVPTGLKGQADKNAVEHITTSDITGNAT